MMLEGKAGVVTGAGRGIGRELALAMARAGAAVVVNDLGVALDGSATGEGPAEQVAAEIVAAGGLAIAHTGSVTSWDAAHDMVARAVATFGRIDFVVNNAGILRDSIFHRMTESDWDAVIAVHLKGAFNLARAAAEHFRAQGSGAVLNMTSTSGLIGNVGQANYAAAKLGLVGLTRAIALDLQRYHVRANAIAPFAWTRMTGNIPEGDDPATRARLENLRKLSAADCAPLAVYLLSDQARDVNGQVFAVRGAEIVLFSLPRPVAAERRPGGWTPEAIADVLPRSFAGHLVPLEVTADVFPYAPPV